MLGELFPELYKDQTTAEEVERRATNKNKKKKGEKV
jgi:hypothetical protein